LELVEKVIELKKDEKLRELINGRIIEFRKLKEEGSCEDIFSELSFCILTANFSAERGIFIQKEIGIGFLYLSEEALARRLRELGHRYPEKRAEYIVKARKFKDKICELVKNSDEDRSKQIRKWMADNIYGIGYKESSHFLRNTGFFNLAIIDFHILDILKKYKLLKQEFKTLTRKRYEEIEKVLEKIATTSILSLGELDLYLWYMETGKVLK
jgi:N-glycosylase/DNA lyase